MNRIAQEVEQDQTYHPVIDAQRPTPEATGADAISAAARQIAETLHLPAILCLTSSGATALRVARERPEPPVVALSPNIATARRLAVLWGTHCVVMEDAPDVDTVVARACNIRVPRGLRQGGPARDSGGRRSARHAGRDQHGAHRLRRRTGRGSGLMR